ncbi:MAG: biotin--[acetyl-CoA-carboxylase] ligase [Lachnospiraceae bacterium]|nr:biotin--[acetyl-CoA-carboxylase] ligase [Lachnospiraceae bacterium]
MDTDIFEKYLHDPDRIRLLVRDSVTSTNLLVKELGAQGAPEGTLMVAAEQTQGRGRLGRRFESPKGTGLYATLLLRPELPLAQSLQITILTAVAVAEGIEAAVAAAEETAEAETAAWEGNAVPHGQSLHPEIKWVNDIYLGNRKICGILAESVLVPGTDRIAYTALGFGINLEEPQGGFTGTATDIAGALYPYTGMPEGFRERLLAEVVNRILRYYDELVSTETADSGFAAMASGNGADTAIASAAEFSYMTRYRASDYLFGKDVWLLDDITRPENARPAHAVAIDAAGRLIVTLPDGSTEAITAGDVTLRLK